MQAAIAQMAELTAETTGNTQLMDVVAGMGGMAQTPISVNAQNVKTNSLGAAMNTDGGQSGAARQRVAESTEVRS